MSQGSASFSVLSTDVLNTTYVVAHGLSLPPQIVMANLTGQSTTGALVQENYQKSFGMAVLPKGGSLTHLCTGAHSDNAQSVTQADVAFQSDCIVCELPIGLGATVTAGKLSVLSIDATNITFKLIEVFTKSAIVKTWFFAGNEFTWIDLRTYQGPTTPQALSFSQPGFKPDMVLFFGDHLSQAVPFVQPDSPTHIGVCDKNLNQWTWAGGENTNGGGGGGGSGRATSYMLGGKCLSIMKNNAADINTQASVQSLDTLGFTLNFDTINLDSGQTTGRRFAALCVQGGNWAAGNFNSFNDVASHTIINTLPFNPQAVMFVSANKAASTSPTVDLASENQSWGLVNQNGNTVAYVGQKGLPWTPSTVVYTDEDATLCYLNASTAPARQGAAAATLITGGFSWQHTVADPTPSFVGYLAYATQPPAGVLTTIHKTVDPKGAGDYLSLAAAFAGELLTHKNMLTQNIILAFDCVKGIDTAAFAVPGWNNPGGAGYMTGPSNYIQVTALDGHVGRIDASGNTYLLDINGNANVLAALVKAEYVRFKQMQLRLTVSDGSSSGGGFFVASTGMVAPTRWEFVNCIEQHILTNGSVAECFHPPSATFDVAGVTCFFINCIAYDALSRDISVTGFNSALAVNQLIVRYNCTAINCNQGFQDHADVIDKNNAALWCDNGWNTSTGPNAASDYNFSTCGPTGRNGALLPGVQSSGTLDAKGAHSSNGLPVYLQVNSALPLPGDPSLIGKGVDLSADATYPFNFDVTGATRTGLWTIGAFQVSTAASLTQGVWWVWVGGVQHNAATVAVKFNLATIHAQLRVATNPSLIGFAQYGDLVTNANNVAQFAISVNPGATYYYQALDNGVATGPIGTFKAHPYPNQPASFAFTCGGCSDTGSNTNLYDAIRAYNPLLHIEFGDLHYWNIISNDQTLCRQALDCVGLAPKRAKLYQNVAADWIWDDHDFGKDNSDTTSLAKTAAQLTYREDWPIYTLPGTVPLPLTQAATIIFVKPVTRYEAKRGHVAFYNWANLTAVNVDLSSVLSTGDAYSIYDVRDLVTPILTGTYAGGTVAFPTTQKPDPTPSGGFVSTPTATAPFFNAFLVVGPAASFATDFYVSPTGGTGAGTITDPWSLTYALSGAGGAIVPGKVIAVRGGTYDTGTTTLNIGTAVSGLLGSGVDAPDSKVIFRAYPGEKWKIRNRANSSASGDAVHFGCDYTWFWNVEWYDDGWVSRDVVPVFNDGLTLNASHANGVKLIHNIIHDFESAGIGAFNGTVNSDKFEAYGCIIYNQGVNRNQQGHNLYLHHAGSSSGVINIDTSIIFNSFGLNCQYYSDSDFVDWANFLNNIWFGAGALVGAPGGTQYQQQSLLLGGNGHAPNNCVVTHNLFFQPDTGVALLRIGYNSAFTMSNIEAGNNYGVGGGSSGGIFSTFVLNAVGSPQSSIYIHDNLWKAADGNSILSIFDAGILGYQWTNNEWHHVSTGGFNGTSYAAFKAATGLGATDTQFDGVPGAPVILSAGPIYHSFIIGRCRFVLTDLRSNRSPNGNPDNASKTMMGATQLSWFLGELTTAKAQGQFVFWFSTVPWIAPVGDNSSDNWGGFTTERQVISNYIEANGLGNSIAIICGDMHSAAIDDGSHDRYNADGTANGLVVFLPFPENQTTQTYGGVYTQGPITHAGTRLMGFAGLVNVVDNGQQLAITYQVFNELGVQLTLQRTYSLPPASGFGVGSLTGSDLTTSTIQEILDRHIERYRLPGYRNG